MKGFKEIQNNPELIKICNGIQNQIKNIKSIGIADQSQNSDQSTDSLTKVKNVEDKDIQTEILEEESDKVTQKYEREKRVLKLQIDDKTTEIKNKPDTSKDHKSGHNEIYISKANKSSSNSKNDKNNGRDSRPMVPA